MQPSASDLSARLHCCRSTRSPYSPRWRPLTLDHVSWARFELGVGAGGDEFPAEFEACAVDPATRFRRLVEGLELLRLLFSAEPVTWNGLYDRLSVSP
ncbi:LLM class flavin-dependent oxidoreductase [Pseudonocardia halophobica]|uniref:LLM class flavin-dependent oxidoreductase n=1 Tax=Pseudonocardia halophobica TaxID=29401 RepID=UPI003D90D75D